MGMATLKPSAMPGGSPEIRYDLPQPVEIPAGTTLAQALVMAGLAPNEENARAGIYVGNVMVDERYVTDPAQVLGVGEHRFRRGGAPRTIRVLPPPAVPRTREGKTSDRPPPDYYALKWRKTGEWYTHDGRLWADHPRDRHPFGTYGAAHARRAEAGWKRSLVAIVPVRRVPSKRLAAAEAVVEAARRFIAGTGIFPVLDLTHALEDYDAATGAKGGEGR